MKPSIEEKKNFEIQIHASYAFSTVASICKYILDTPIGVNDQQYYPLVVAIYTIYARPFTKSRGFVKLDETTVPKKFNEIHQELMTYRDKMYAHSDKDMVNEDYGPVNELRITVSEDGRCRIWSQPVLPPPPKIKNILNLANRMKKIMEYRTDKFIKKYMEKINIASGDYLFNVESETKLLSLRESEQTNQERLRGRRAASLYGTPEAPHP